ncbi:MAG: hypothetical protein ABI183_21980 [Polyangiaceae bacterium]
MIKVIEILGLAPIAFALVACGGSPKQADDASSQNTAKTDDEGAPKWDSSSSTTTPSSSSGSSPATDSSSSGGDTAASGASPNGSSSSTGTTDNAAAPAASNAGPHGEAEIALKRAARQATANCGAAKDSDGKATGPFGKTTVSIVLGRNGHSRKVTPDSSFDGKPAGNCIIQAFTNLTYAPWAGADVTTQWEVELVQPK